MHLSPDIVHEIVIDHQQAASRHLAEMSPEGLDQDWKLEEFFGIIYVINLRHAHERLLKMTETLKGIGVKSFQIFRAIDGQKELAPEIWQKFKRNWKGFNLRTQKGRERFDKMRKAQAGCYMSHYLLIQSIKKQFDHAIDLLNKAKAQGDAKKVASAAKKARRYSSALILEDDAGFGIVNEEDSSFSLKGCGTVLRQVMQELPKNWD